MLEVLKLEVRGTQYVANRIVNIVECGVLLVIAWFTSSPLVFGA